MLRNTSDALYSGITQSIASMGPQQLCCGIHRESDEGKPNIHKLQWGRSSYAAEYIHVPNVRVGIIAQLQWGRSSYAAEYRFLMDKLSKKGEASMGPQQLCCGIRRKSLV